MAGWLRHQLAFFRQFREQYETTGAVAPSSRGLARSMVRFLAARDEQPVRVLEIGPGTGPVTDEIVRQLRPGDAFDLVELNEAFVDILKRRFETETHWQQAAELSEIHQLPVQDYQPTELYDFVISGLPLNNFPAELVETIADHYFRLLRPGGRLAWFEYMYIRPIRKVVTRGANRQRIIRIDDVLGEHCKRDRVARDNIWINMPPAWVQHLQKSGGQA